MSADRTRCNRKWRRHLDMCRKDSGRSTTPPRHWSRNARPKTMEANLIQVKTPSDTRNHKLIRTYNSEQHTTVSLSLSVTDSSNPQSHFARIWKPALRHALENQCFIIKPLSTWFSLLPCYSKYCKVIFHKILRTIVINQSEIVTRSTETLNFRGLTRIRMSKL